MANWVPWAVAASAVISMAVAVFHAGKVLRADPGSERMREVSLAIRDGAMAFVRQEFRYCVPFVLVVAVLLSVVLRNHRGWMVAICYVFGAACSLAAGFVGLSISTRANCRTTEAARTGIPGAFAVAFRSGCVMGLTVAGLGLLGLTACYLVFEVWFDLQTSAHIILGFALGAASVALFARIGGGIFTKAADVGADLVGKVEEGIPEDDPRNPAVVADNVGDNVGDVAGMGSDLFASFVAAMIAPIMIAATGTIFRQLGGKGMVLPLSIGGAGTICSVVCTLFFRGSTDARPKRYLLTVMVAATALAALSSFFLVWGILGWSRIGIFFSLLVGMLAGLGIGLVSAYYTSTSFKPVLRIAGASNSGAGTTVICGLSEGMMSTVLSVLFLAVAVGVAYISGRAELAGGGVYGVSLAAIGMLCTTGIIVSVDSFGCVADNAGGIAEMAGLQEEVRDRTDVLDALGNTTAAISKGFAIGAAGLVTLALMAAFTRDARLYSLDLIDEATIVGLLVGAMIPFALSSLTMRSVHTTASTVVEEVRRQFREIAGLREGKPGVRPDYSTAIRMITRTALNQTIVPASLALVLPVLVGLIFGTETLGGFLAGALASGFLLGVFMANTGGAWDNAKKYIEEGNLGGKGSPAYVAAVVGDTVGDPLKDTSGPAMNILIKVMALVSLLLVPIFVVRG
jgi:K(+)-stimulated pyrophosphate-energized sodium pump